jgi:hypothetical protein
MPQQLLTFVRNFQIMMNKIYAKVEENFHLLVDVQGKLCALRNRTDNQFEHQTTILKLMTGVLIVIAGLLAVIAWS